MASRLPTPSKSLSWLSWSSAGFGAQALGQFGLLMVLARTLSLEEYGVVTAIVVVAGLCRTLAQGLVGPGLVQKEDLRAEHASSAFALSIYFALGFTALLWVLAPAVAAFFGMDSLVALQRSLALVLILQAFGFVPEGLLHRELRLKAIAGAELASYTLGYLPAGVAAALMGYGPWAIIAASVGQVGIKSLVLVILRRPPMSLRLHMQATREILFFAGGILSARVFSYGASQVDYLVVGRLMSQAALGVYGRAYQLMAMPAMFLGEVVDRVLFPLMSRYQTDRERLGDTYGRGISLICMVMIPASVGGVVLAPELIRLVLGPGWEGVVVPFQVLMSGLVFRTGYKIGDSLARSAGTVYARAWRQLLYAVLVAVGAWIGTGWGVAGVAWGVFGALAGNYLSMALLSLQTTGMPWRRFAALHFRGLALGLFFLLISLPAATFLRGSGAGPAVVVALTALVATGLYALGAWKAPRLALGPDGNWLIHKLTGRSVS